MQDTSSAFYKRVGALGAAAALAVSGAFIASPAIAAPTAEPDATTTDAPVTTATEAPASKPAADKKVTDKTATDEAAAEPAGPTEEAGTEAGTLAPGLAEALLRDLGLTVEEFEAAGELGKKAADALPKLQATEGFVGIAIEDNTIVITGSGEALQTLALELDATLVDPVGEEVTEEAAVTEAPSEEATDAPSAEATEAAEEPAPAVETAAPTSITGDPYLAVANLRNAYISSVGVEGLQSILLTADGYVISVNKAATVGGSVLTRSMADIAGTPADAFAEQFTNVTIANASGPATPLEDVVNGQGYATFTGESGKSCSIGFNGFDEAGKAAVISAGHCANDGKATATILSIPADDPAGNGSEPSLGSELGTWGFSQFGGENNSPIADPVTGGNIGTDIGVINGINRELDLLPEVTQWTNTADLTADAVKLTGTVDAIVGAPMCKSGRTTGWSCGHVTGLGEFYVAGTSTADIRGVWGFESTLEVNAAPGDSGGAVISGTNAMGLVSAGPEGGNSFFSTSLTDGLKRLDGYTVALFVDAPKLTSHEDKATVLTDAAITGSAPAGSTTKLTLNGETTDLKAAADGSWSFDAPSTVPSGGKLEFKVQAVNGFNKSKTSSYELTVEEAPLDAPVITNPANGAKIADTFQTLKGTGTAGAEVTVKVTGTNAEDDTKDAKDSTAGTLAAVEETATVAANGTWELKLDKALSYGAYTVTAVQDGIVGKAKSPTATSTFTVFLQKAKITSIADGQEFVEGENPTEIAGTGTAGATVDLTLGETKFSTLVDDEGRWEVTGIPVLAPGFYSVRAAHTLDGVTSEDDYLVFRVTAVVVEEQAPPVVPPAPAPTQPGDPAPTPKPDTNRDGLADTGAAGMGLFAGAGALLTAGGISALLINRRRQTQDA